MNQNETTRNACTSIRTYIYIDLQVPVINANSGCGSINHCPGCAFCKAPILETIQKIDLCDPFSSLISHDPINGSFRGLGSSIPLREVVEPV